MATFASLYARDARPDRGARLRRLRRPAAALGADEAARSRRIGARCDERLRSSAAGSAGLAAALELVDAGHDVTLSRPGRRSAAPSRRCPSATAIRQPPPDNGQHIALGCFTEYLRFLDRIGEGGSYRRLRARAARDRRGRPRRHDRPLGRVAPPLPASLVRRPAARRERRPPPSGSAAGDGRRSATLLRSLGCPEASIDRFWDVFVRPALNLPRRRGQRRVGRLHRPDGAARRQAARAIVILPTRPLGAMHGDAAGRALDAAGATVQTNARVDSLDDLDADADHRRRPRRGASAPARRARPAARDSPIVSVHLLFDRPLLAHPLAALLGQRRALGLRSGPSDRTRRRTGAAST